MFDLLHNSFKECKMKLQGTGLEPARCVSIVQLIAECVYQFRHPCKNKIHNSSIKDRLLQLNANQSLFFNSKKRILPIRIDKHKRIYSYN